MSELEAKVTEDAKNASSLRDDPSEVDRTSKDYYFDSYAHHGIHEEMLKDTVRTRAYMNAIMQNQHLFKDKIVLDVGCGTGILSMFAARAGAKKVYAVECSGIVMQAKQIVKDNGLENVVEVINKKMEDVDLPVEHVDIILSEWMGYFLLYESMLETVLKARDRYLRPETGIMLPDKAVLYLTCIEDEQYKRDKIDFWDDVYGFDMRVIKQIALAEPLVDVVESRSVMSDVKPVLSLDILTCTVDDLSFSTEVALQAVRQDYCHAFCAFFECAFTQIHKPVVFSTSPHAQYTHWKQTVFYLEQPLTMKQGEIVTARISCNPNAKNTRDLDIQVDYKFDGACMGVDRVQNYRLR